MRLFEQISKIRSLAGLDQISEIDWSNTFNDVKHQCVNTEDVVDYLNRVRANKDKDTESREKFDKTKPYVHAKTAAFSDTEIGIDIDFFADFITQKPRNIFNTNAKIEKSGGPFEHVYKTGIPAIRGIVFDKKSNKFHYVNTCPGAGTCRNICYALKGNYIIFSKSFESVTRRLNLLLNDPDSYKEMMYNELVQLCKIHKAIEGYKPSVVIRWNDSGDFFTKKYTQIANDVIGRVKSEGYNVVNYAYTKSSDTFNSPTNFDSLTFSYSNAKKSEAGKIDKTNGKIQITVPKDLFKDLNLLNIVDEKELKQRIAKKYQFNINTLVTSEELVSIPKGNKKVWNVIMSNVSGDDAAFRSDVKTVLILEH